MSLLEWKKENSVGVKEFDKQHQKMFTLINNLYNAMQEGEGIDFVKKALQDMQEYAQYHFSTEETYFKKFDYPESKEHINQHQSYIEHIQKSYDGLEVDSTTPFKILDFLEDWWLNHINGSDKKYTEFFNEHGLK